MFLFLLFVWKISFSNKNFSNLIVTFAPLLGWRLLMVYSKKLYTQYLNRVKTKIARKGSNLIKHFYPTFIIFTERKHLSIISFYFQCKAKIVLILDSVQETLFKNMLRLCKRIQHLEWLEMNPPFIVTKVYLNRS